MHTELLWAGVSFTALGGRTEDLLEQAARQNAKLRGVCACSGGFSAHCGARAYLRLAGAAHRCGARLRVTKRHGAYFSLRGLLRRRGLWLGLCAGFLLIGMSGRLIWSIQYRDMTVGQQARAAAVLRACGIREGAEAEKQLLESGTAALLGQGSEFSWAELNFEGGRLTVETAPAPPVPAIAAGKDSDITAKTAGRIASVEIRQGTAAVAVGQDVSAGQVLIAASRAARDGTPVVGKTAGTVRASFSWQGESVQPLTRALVQPELSLQSEYTLDAAGHSITIPGLPGSLPVFPAAFAAWNPVRRNTAADAGQMVSAPPAVQFERHYPLTVLGLGLPVAVTETTQAAGVQRRVTISENLALALARLDCSRQLYAQWPDAQILTVQEDSVSDGENLRYHTVLGICADIGQNAPA